MKSQLLRVSYTSEANGAPVVGGFKFLMIHHHYSRLDEKHHLYVL